MLKRLFLGVVALGVIAAGVIVVLLSGSQETLEPVRPDIAFADKFDTSLVDPDHTAKRFRVDMARVEHEHPLSRVDLAGLNPEHILSLSQEEIDQLYGRLTVGAIPDGAYLGDLFFPKGEDGLTPRLERILGGLKGRIAGDKIALVEKAGRALWKGKMFYRDERLLRNFIDDFKPLERLIDDPDALPTASVPREGWLKYIRPTTEVWLLFPAKLYCGQSLLDGRREAVIIDYAFNDGLPGYQPGPDDLVGRNGLKIRDEIRMIRPGFYLGRAYANRVFLLNFLLYNADIADAGRESFASGAAVDEDCWTGEQQRHADAR